MDEIPECYRYELLQEELMNEYYAMKYDEKMLFEEIEYYRERSINKHLGEKDE